MIDRRLIRIASDPVRLQVLTILNEHPAGATELAGELEIDTGTVGRHLQALLDEGMIEVVGEVLSRGAVEPRYRALVRALWDDEEWATFSLREQMRLTRWIIEMVRADTTEALEQGTFTARADTHASRTVPYVDEQGWDELRRIHADALDAVFTVQAASAERLAEAGEPGFPVLSAMFCCELPSQEDGEEAR